jgi:uncharacterized protein (TIGR03435 family)
MPLIISLLAIGMALGQDSEPPKWQIDAGGKMAFDVASVKPTEALRMPNSPLTPDNAYGVTGGLLSGAVQLTVYIQFAYKVRMTPEQVGAMTAHFPRWVSDDLFEIDAKVAGNPTKDQIRLMMQALLADRFGLKLHFEKHEAPVLVLSLVKKGRPGPGLRVHPSDAGCDDLASASFPASCYDFQIRPGGKGTRELGGRNVTIAELAEVLPIVDRTLGRPVVDRTGLNGRYDVRIGWTPESNDSPSAQPSAPNFREALNEQMGMKLGSGRDWVRTLVIDRVERPSAN